MQAITQALIGAGQTLMGRTVAVGDLVSLKGGRGLRAGLNVFR